MLIFFLLIFPVRVNAQVENDRIAKIEKQLQQIAETSETGLKSKVDLSVSSVPIQEFIRSIALANQVNINVDPNLNARITSNFSNESVLNILVYLCKQYDLDIEIFGTIISLVKYKSRITNDGYPPVNARISYAAYNDLISFDLKQDTLINVVKRITGLTGKNIVLSPGLSLQVVSGFIQKASLEAALDKLCFANDLRLMKTEDNFFLIEKRVLPADQAVSNKASNLQFHQGAIPIKTDIDTLTKQYLISFEANNVTISDIIKELSKKLKINYFLFSEIKGTCTLSVKLLSLDNVLKMLFKGTDYTFSKENNVYLIGERKMEGLRVTKVIQLQFRSVDVLAENIPADIRKDIEIKVFPELNSIIVSGSGPAISELETFIKTMDRTVPLIMIEVIVLDVNKTRTVSTGITAGKADSVATGGTLLPGVNYTLNAGSLNNILNSLNGNSIVNLGRVTPDFYLSLKALEDRKNIKIRSTPKLSTLNGHEASLRIGQTQYYLIETQNVTGSLNPQTIVTRQWNPVKADLSITINPVVSGDEQVTLKVDVEFSNFTTVPSQNAPPGVATRQFKSLIRVRNEEMVILGGLEETEKSETGSGVPFLSRIPVLKWFFSQKSKTDRDSKLVVIIKPRIVN